ncbi:MAG: hypothetical protein WC938_03680 [Candidatus Paceibacterota bacterium]|jgi:hypothetical protein
MAMKIRSQLSPLKIIGGIAFLAIIVSMGMVFLQRYPTLPEGVLVVIFGIFIPMALSN